MRVNCTVEATEILANRTSSHILGTSTNLLGFCLFVITSLHFSNKTENSFVDELTSVVALLLTLSSCCSFIAIRTGNKSREDRLEAIAEYLFLISLLGIFAIILFITVKYA